MDCAVIQSNCLIKVIHSRSIPWFATFLILLILRLLHSQLLSIGHAHLNFACFDIIFHFLPSLILFVCVIILSLVRCLVFEITLLCCEVNKFLTQVNLLVEWILFKFLELSKFPFTLLFLLFFPSLFLI